MRVALDGTPFLDRRTGVGVFVDEVARRLVRRPELEVCAYGLTLLGFGEVRRRVPLGVHPLTRPMPAPQLRRWWAAGDRPPIEWWTGPIDVVHGVNFLVPPARWAAEVVTVHDLTPLHFPELCTEETRLYPRYIERAVARGAWVHTVSAFVADEVRAAFDVDPDRVVVIHNGGPAGVPDDPARAARGRALAGGRPYVLAVGTVEPRKDYPTLVRAFERVAAEHPDPVLVIAGGEGWGAEALDLVLGASPAADRVVRLGWVSDADRVALVAGADVLAYPSVYEGFGLPPLEAMAHGVPVVATRAGAVPEIVGDAALLVDVGDADALAAALSSVLVDDGLRRRLVAAGADRAGRFSWDETAEAMVALYRAAAGERPAPPRRRPPVLTLTGPPGRQGGDPADPRTVRVVVLNYQGGDHLPACLDALAATDLDAPALAGLALEVVVVDNASTDGSAEAVAARSDGVLLLRNTANTGFPANNLALHDLAGVRYVALVNSDAFVEPGWLAPLVATLDADEDLGAACPRILLESRYLELEVIAPTHVPGGGDERRLGVRIHGARLGGTDVWSGVRTGGDDHSREHGYGGTFQWTGARTLVRLPVPAAPTGGQAALLLAADRPTEVEVRCGDARVAVRVGVEPGWCAIDADGPVLDLVNNAGSLVFDDGYGAGRGFLEPDGPAFDVPSDPFAFCGGGVLLRPDLLADVGAFDERFFLYYEDTDLSWRGQGRGWRYRYVPAARIRHRHAATTGEGSPLAEHYNERNRLLMLTKNAPVAMVRREVGALGAQVVDDLSTVGRRVLSRHRADRADLARLVHAWRRGRSLAAFGRQAPFMARRRRRIRRRLTVPDDELNRRLTPRADSISAAGEPPRPAGAAGAGKGVEGS